MTSSINSDLHSDNISFISANFPEHENEIIVAVATCALEREVLWQGKLLMTQNYLLFHARLFNNVQKIAIRWEDILTVEKKNTGGVFPNAIKITTLQSKYNFASFLRRDLVYMKMRSLWESNLLIRNSALKSKSQVSFASITLPKALPTSNENLSIQAFETSTPHVLDSTDVIMHEDIDDLSRLRSTTPSRVALKKIDDHDETGAVLQENNGSESKKPEAKIQAETTSSDKARSISFESLFRDENNQERSYTCSLGKIMTLSLFIFSLIWYVKVAILYDKIELLVADYAKDITNSKEELLDILLGYTSNKQSFDLLDAAFMELLRLKEEKNAIVEMCNQIIKLVR